MNPGVAFFCLFADSRSRRRLNTAMAAMLAILLCVASLSGVARGQSPEYEQILNAYGISEGKEKFPNRCPFVGDGTPLLSISEEFARQALQLGFTKSTICLLISRGLKYHPETGAALRRIASKEYDFPIGISMVGCYRRGQPLVDCEFNFNVETGCRYDSEQKKTIKEVAARHHSRLVDMSRSRGNRSDEFAQYWNRTGRLTPQPVRDAREGELHVGSYILDQGQLAYYSLEAAAGPSIGGEYQGKSVAGVQSSETVTAKPCPSLRNEHGYFNHWFW